MTTPKPVLPHYSPTRRALWNCASSLVIRAQSEEADAERYDDYAMSARTRAKNLRAEADALKVAARALGGMDKSGIVVEPIDEAQPVPHTKLVGID